MLEQILIPVVIFIGLGAVMGTLLAVASRIFAVERDERAEEIGACLPGANCGGCGYAGCAGLAEAISKGEARVNQCTVGGAETAARIAAIMGVEAEHTVRMRAQVMCSGTSEYAKKKYIYEGISSCEAAAKLGGGDKLCKFACVGLGSCVSVCPFEAISIKDGTAVVDYTACNGCGLCVSACPKHIIELIPYDTYNWVGCMSRESGARSAEGCKSGCTGCGICARVCPEDAVILKQSRLAAIDYTKCSGCGMCFDACPQGVIWKSDAFGADGLVFTKGSKKNSV